MDENKPLLWGFFRRRYCVVLTWRGWLALVAIFAIATTLAVQHAYDFLAMNAPLSGGILVVEGWGPDIFMDAVAKEYRKNHYDGIFTTGGPLETGGELLRYHTYAEMAAATLEQMGIDPKSIHVVPADPVVKDRTYASALALKAWLSGHGMEEKTITVMSVGTHCRRSRLLFDKAFGDGFKVGVISVPDEGFDPRHWWQSSAGFRSVTSEMIAYFYARFLFHPPKEN